METRDTQTVSVETSEYTCVCFPWRQLYGILIWRMDYSGNIELGHAVFHGEVTHSNEYIFISLQT